jgi:hypothetical protein
MSRRIADERFLQIPYMNPGAYELYTAEVQVVGVSVGGAILLHCIKLRAFFHRCRQLAC